ncbi:MAG: endonuclease/exonuclease/phosphatase family protein [Marmoricola sp.]
MLLLGISCLLLVGATLAVTQTRHPSRSVRHASTVTSSHLPSSATVSPSPTAPLTSSASPTKDPSLKSSASARSAELVRLAKKAQALSKKRRNVRPVAEFTMANFNIQGATHRGGIIGRTTRTRDLLLSHHVDVVALQEFQRPQRQIFARVAGGTYGVFPGATARSLDAENSVAWRKDTFALVRGETRPYRYFRGGIRNMPRVLLRNLKTGVELWVTSYHNPASCCGYGNAAPYRAQDVRAQVTDATALVTATKAPLIISGDMNDRAAYLCAMTTGVDMHSADGGNHVGGCHVPPSPWIDWILGTRDVEFSGYLRDRSGFVRSTSDHPIVVTRVRVTGQPGDGAKAGG